MAKESLKEILERGEQVFAPCIWDCLSARAAEVCGYKASLLSSCLFAWSAAGIPDFGLVTLDEVEWAVKRISEATALPLIIDAEDGYGPTTLHCYRAIDRLTKAGASAFTIEDSVAIRGTERHFTYDEKGNRIDGNKPSGIISEKAWLSKIEAALAATEGTDAMIIARTHAYSSEGLDAAIDRAAKATKLGAQMTYVAIPHWQDNRPLCRKIAERLPGWKMYGDVFSRDGKTDIELDEAMQLGFNLVTMHCFQFGAFYGMCDVGKHNIQNGNTIYSDELRKGGDWLKKEMLEMQDYHSAKMLEIEKKCFDKAEEFYNRPAAFSASMQTNGGNEK